MDEKKEILDRRRMAQQDEIDLLDLFRYLLKYWLILGLCFLLGGVGAGLYTRFMITPMYSASSTVYMRGMGSTITSISDLQMGTYLSQDYKVIFKSRPVLENTISKLGLNTSYKGLSGMVNVTAESGTRIMSIRVTAPDPELARDICNTVVKYGVDTVKEIDAKEPYIIEKAIADYAKVSPSMSRNVMMGALGGAVACAGILVLRYLLNDTITSVEMIEEKLGIPVIGTVGESTTMFYDKGIVANKKKKHRHRRKESEGGR